MDDKVKEIRERWSNMHTCYGITHLEAEEDISVLLSLLSEKEKKIEELENKFPCGHRKIDWDDSYGNCVACTMKEYADKYDDKLGLEQRIHSLESGIEEHKKATEEFQSNWSPLDYACGVSRSSREWDKELYKLKEGKG